MTFDEKTKALNDCLYEHCCCNNCDECEFFDSDDDRDGEYSCGIRDHVGKVPYHDGWNMKTALGIEKPYSPVFPEEVRNYIMQHFTRGE